MSIPLNLGGSGISTALIQGHFLPPDDLSNFLLMDFELGGFGLSDTSEGLQFQTWTLRYFPDTGDMVVHAANSPPTILFTRMDITEISLAFDQNMHPFVAFVEDDVAKFWWFDLVANDVVFTNLPGGSRSPRCCIDDKRGDRSATSDIILAYINSDVLYERQERDRYQDQRTLADPYLHPDGGQAVLLRVGMNEFNRLQFLGDLINVDRSGCP